jgi:hypothetical protein
MRFTIDTELLTRARTALSGWNRLYWIIGGAGSGKTTVCRSLSASYGIPVYDMDAHVYGAYHGRFTRERHPVNTAWATAQDGLAWLLAMSWEEFDSFNQAALPEYLDLLAEDLAATDPGAGVVIDGGICNPALVAQAIPARQIVCLANPEQTSAEIWQGSDERNAMKEMIFQLPQPEEAWHTFLEFDTRITRTILKESHESHISVCSRDSAATIDEFAAAVAHVLGMS